MSIASSTAFLVSLLPGTSALAQTSAGSYWREAKVWSSVVGQVVSVVYVLLLGYMFTGIGLRTREEDVILCEEFQEEWDAWARETRYRLVPYVY